MEVYIFNLLLLLGVLPFLIYLKGSKRNQITDYLLPFIVLVFFASLYEYIGTLMLKLGTAYWFRIYSFLEFYTVWYFYYKIFNFKKAYLFYGIFYFFLYTYLLIDWSPYDKEIKDLPLNLAITFMVIVSSFLWFLDVFKKMEDKPLYLRAEFYYISILLIYFSGTFLVFLMADYILTNESINILDYWVLIIIFNVILRGTLIFAIWRARFK